MFSLALDILLAALVLVPVLYFTLNRKKSSSDYNDFIQSLKNQSIKIDKQSSFSDSYLALDQGSKTLYAKKSGEPMITIQLKNGSTITTIRNYVPGNSTALASASLQITDSTSGKYIIPLFGHSQNNKFDQTEILDAVEWESKIKSCIAK